MKNAEALLRCLLGPVRASVLPFSLALERTAYLLFTERRSMDDISVMKDVCAATRA